MTDPKVLRQFSDLVSTSSGKAISENQKGTLDHLSNLVLDQWTGLDQCTRLDQWTSLDQ